MDQDGFTLVNSFKFRYRNSNPNGKNGRPRKNKKYFTKDDLTVPELTHKIDIQRLHLTESLFYKELSENLKKFLRPICPLEFICYGLGSVQESKTSRYQLALALLMRDLLEIETKIQVYDPIFTQLDHDLLSHYDIEIIPTNEYAKRVVNPPCTTLLYMPHCSDTLYNNVLSVNWSPEQLEYLVIIGNCFETYIELRTTKHLEEKIPYLPLAIPLMECHAFPLYVENDLVFNNLAVQFFPRVKLQGIENSFWEKTQEEIKARMKRVEKEEIICSDSI